MTARETCSNPPCWNTATVEMRWYSRPVDVDGGVMVDLGYCRRCFEEITGHKPEAS